MPAKMAEAEAVCRQAPNAYGKIVSFVEKMAQAAKNVVSSLQGNDGDNIQRSDRFGKTPLARLGIASSLLKLNKAGGVLDDLVRYVKGELRLAQITNPDLREAFRAMLPERPEGARDTDACKDVGRWLDQKFQSRLAKFCVAALKAGMTGPAIEDLKESSILNVFEKGIKAEFKNVLNTTGWNTIDKGLRAKTAMSFWSRPSSSMRQMSHLTPGVVPSKPTSPATLPSRSILTTGPTIFRTMRQSAVFRRMACCHGWSRSRPSSFGCVRDERKCVTFCRVACIQGGITRRTSKKKEGSQ